MLSRSFSLWPLIVLLAAPFLPVQEPVGRGVEQRPSVMVLLMDATRPDYLSCYGHPRPTTPAIDRIAAEGVLYEECIATASWTLPSLASIFTGVFPSRHGVSAKNLNLADEHRTLAEYLQEAGYRTRAFSSNPWVGNFSGMDQGFEQVEDLWRGEPYKSADSGAAAANGSVLAWIDSLPPQDAFFAFVHYMEPHFPYNPPAPFDSVFAPAGLDKEVIRRVRAWRSPRELGYIVKDPDSMISEEELAALRCQYEGEVAYLDFRIGELVEALREKGRLDGTILIILADHGEHLGEHGFLDHKFSVYEELIRVPLVVRYPAAIAQPMRINSVVQTIDLLPSIGRLCGFQPTQVEGVELPWRDSEARKGRTAFTEFSRPLLFTDVIEQHFPMADYAFIDRALLSVRSGGYKLIRASNGKHELFDLSDDPPEGRNRFHELPAVAADLMGKAEAFQRRSRDLPPRID